jgi:hypothetical protein
VAAILFCLPPLTWTATGLLAGWLAARRGKSWRVGFAMGFCFSTAGVVLAALPRRSHHGGAIPHGTDEPTVGAADPTVG